MGMCGWCDSSFECLTGTSTGPSSGSCSDWRYYSSSCTPSDPCTTAAFTCGACTAMGACGWCESSGECQTGGSGGPTSTFCSDWRYTSDVCP